MMGHRTVRGGKNYLPSGGEPLGESRAVELLRLRGIGPFRQIEPKRIDALKTGHNGKSLAGDPARNKRGEKPVSFHRGFLPHAVNEVAGRTFREPTDPIKLSLQAHVSVA